MKTAGSYYGRPTQGVTGTASTGTPQMVLTFNVTHIANAEGEWDSITPFDARSYVFLSDGAWPHSEKRLKAIGFDGNFDSPKFNCDGIALRCEHDNYNGKPKEKWDIDTGGGEVKKADDNVIRTLAAKWRSAAKPSSAPKPPGKPAAPARQPVAAGSGGAAPLDPDEIPFAPNIPQCAV